MQLLSQLLVALTLIAASGFADTTGVEEAPQPDTIKYHPALNPSQALQVTNPADFEQCLTQNPTAALCKSLFVPGLGQIGNKRYFKAAVIIGLESWFVASALRYGKQASDYRSKWESASDVTVRKEFYRLYDDRRYVRNKYAWFTGIVIFVSMFDAYVDAHLSGSPEEQDQRLDLQVKPTDNGGARAVLSYSF